MPASPMLFLNDAQEARWQAAVLVFGNGSMEEVLVASKERDGCVTATPTPKVGAVVVDDDSWKTQTVDFYVNLTTIGTPEADAVAIDMVREFVPLRSASFFFSCISSRFEPLLQQLNEQIGREAVRLDWSHSGQWECQSDKGLVRTTHPEHRRILDDCARKYDGVKHAASAAGVAPSAAVHPVDSGIYLAPLRVEHIDLVVKNWPWATPNSAPMLIGTLIRDNCTRCVFAANGEPLAWALEQRLGPIGMLHTQPDHRGKGYAALLVESMTTPGAKKLHLPAFVPGSNSAEDDAAALKQSSLDPTVWAIITKGNTASEGVFSRRGFTKIGEVLWVRWTPQQTQ